MVTQARLRELFRYNPRTGVFVRRQARGPAKAGSVAGCLNVHGYTVIGVDYCEYLAHRLAFLYMTGDFPVGVVDHLNGVGTDNRWGNLRDVTHAVNMQNVHCATKKAVYRGVSWDAPRGKYKAQLMVNGRRVLCKRYDTAELAKEAYLAAKRKYTTAYIK